MILLSVTVENFKGFRGPATLELEPGAPVLLGGPNGAGKSTLLEAVERALIDNHGTQGAEAERLRPRGAAVAPRVSVTFEHGGARYRITKRFLDAPGSKLEKANRSGAFELLAENKTADQQVRNMLAGDAPARGLATTDHGGLLRVLCSRQGDITLPPLSGRILNDIRAMLGAQMAGARGSALEQLAAKRYSAAWSSRGPRKGELTRIEAGLEEARAHLVQCKERLAHIDELECSAREAHARFDQHERELLSLGPRLEGAEAAERELLGIRQRLETARMKAAAAQERYLRLREQVAQITEAVAQRERLTAQQPQLLAASKAARQGSDDAAAAAEAARENWNRAAAAAEYRELESKLAALRQRIERAAALADEDNSIARRIAELNAPSAQAWNEIQSAARDRDEAALRLDALALRIELTAERELQVEAGGEVAAVAAGETFTVRGDGSAALRIPGVASIRASGPSGGACEWRDKLERASGRLARHTAPFASSDLDELAARLAQANELRLALERGAAELKSVLDGETPDELRRREASWSVRLNDLPLGVDCDARQAQQDWQAEEAKRALAAAALANTEAAAKANDTAIAVLDARLASLQADGRSIEHRNAELDLRLREAESSNAEVAAIEAELKKLAPDAADRAGALRQERTRVEALLAKARDQFRQDEAAQRALRVQGPYSSAAQAEERVAAFESAQAAERLRLEAIQRLWQAIEARKAAALEGLAAPVAEAATRILEKIAGRLFARIELGDGLAPAWVEPEGADGEADLEEMSGGEREQIFFATRLALADLLARQEPQLVVLDDALLNTDDERMRRILGELEARAGRMQFLILTCHPERYRALAGATALHIDNFKIVPHEVRV